MKSKQQFLVRLPVTHTTCQIWHVGVLKEFCLFFSALSLRLSGASPSQPSWLDLFFWSGLLIGGRWNIINMQNGKQIISWKIWRLKGVKPGFSRVFHFWCVGRSGGWAAGCRFLCCKNTNFVSIESHLLMSSKSIFLLSNLHAGIVFKTIHTTTQTR